MNIFGLHITFGKSKKRAYEAADKGRRGNSFRLAHSTGANREISGALVTLRNRSRHMVRNNGWAKRAVEAITKHTIGEGIQPAPIGNLSKIKKIKGIWLDWAGSTECDWYGKNTFYGLQELAMRSIVEGGEALFIRRWVKDNESGIPFKLQLLEGDQLDHSRNGANDKGYTIMGVQYTKEGLLSGYWLFDYHPGDLTSLSIGHESRFIEKSDVLHVFEVLRSGQCRGIPFGVAGFMKMSDFSDYEDAQLLKQKMAAGITAFITGVDTLAPKKEEEQKPLEFVVPGTVEYLNMGETVQFPDSPNISDYDNYSTRILQGIASAYGITYEMLTMDYSRVNFTSGRMAKIDVTSNFRSWQYNMIVPQLCAPVWKWFIEACMITGKMIEPVKTDWTAPRIQQLDPVKETNAQIMRIKAGLATPGEIIREMGREPDELIEELKQNKESYEKAGLFVDSFTYSSGNNSTKEPNINVIEE
jgi:lambda family phage portal protein